MTLSRKVALLVLLNLAAVAVLLAVFLQAQFGLDPNALLAGPVRERILAASNEITRELEGTNEAERVEVLRRFERNLEVGIRLITPDGDPLDGGSGAIPAAVMARIHGGRPVRPPGQGPMGEWMGGDEKALRPPPAGKRKDDKKKGGPGRPAEAVFSLSAGDPSAYWIGTRIPVQSSDGEAYPGVLLFRTESMFRGPLFLDLRMWLGFGAAVLMASLLCWLPFLQGITNSVARMRSATERIAKGQFQVHAGERRNDELGDLGKQIDALSERLEGFVKGQKRFLGDIAHELSAPIARVQFALGILEQRADPTLQSAVQQLHEEVQEMSQLVNELLSFSKAGMASDPSKVELSLQELRLIVERAVAREGGGLVKIGVPVDLQVLAHEAFLSRAIGNVVRNAVHHAGAGGPIEIQAREQGDRVLLTIRDSGPGLPEDALADVFMPFYRPDESRNRHEGGGAGLGLAIVKDCVEACRGSVVCRNRKDRSGLEVELSLVGR